ncbi:MAG: peptide ABC transporter permease, partial [Meiothermus sp.]
MASVAQTTPSKHSTETPTRLAVRRFSKSTSGKIGLVLAIVLILVALLAPVFKPYDPTTDRDYINRLKAPS